MKKIFLISTLRRELYSKDGFLEQYIYFDMKLYLFGSATRKYCPSDIDIAILYHRHNLDNARIIRDNTIQLLESLHILPIDCMLISYDEENQINFLQKERAELVFP